ncbi:MAG: hypothetical protein AB8B91_06490 [Rubripirellula sp.]
MSRVITLDRRSFPPLLRSVRDDRPIALILSGSKDAMECRFSYDVNRVGSMSPYLKYYAREVLSAIEDCKSLKMMPVDNPPRTLHNLAATTSNQHFSDGSVRAGL